MILSKNDCERLLEAFEIYEEITEFYMDNFSHMAIEYEEYPDRAGEAYSIFMNFKEYVEENS